MHGMRGERHHHLTMVVVENGEEANGWNRRAVGKEKENIRKMEQWGKKKKREEMGGRPRRSRRE